MKACAKGVLPKECFGLTLKGQIQNIIQVNFTEGWFVTFYTNDLGKKTEYIYIYLDGNNQKG